MSERFMVAVVIDSPLRQSLAALLAAAWLPSRYRGTAAPATESFVPWVCRLSWHSGSTAALECKPRCTSDLALQPGRRSRALLRSHWYPRRRNMRSEPCAGDRYETKAAGGSRAWE